MRLLYLLAINIKLSNIFWYFSSTFDDGIKKFKIDKNVLKKYREIQFVNLEPNLFSLYIENPKTHTHWDVVRGIRMSIILFWIRFRAETLSKTTQTSPHKEIHFCWLQENNNLKLFTLQTLYHSITVVYGHFTFIFINLWWNWIPNCWRKKKIWCRGFSLKSSVFCYHVFKIALLISQIIEYI